jgi:hypothetical protein
MGYAFSAIATSPQPQVLNRRGSVQSLAAHHYAKSPAHHCTSICLLTLTEEDPRRASHRDTTREADTPPASQDASYIANSRRTRYKLKFQTTHPWRVRRQIKTPSSPILRVLTFMFTIQIVKQNITCFHP